LGSYAVSLAAVCAAGAIMLVFFASIGREAKDVDMRVAAPAE
jgi:hypothetical protein